MVHDPELLEKIDALPKEGFNGSVFRATRQNLNPLVSSFSGGRWMPPGMVGILYTSLMREGALAEISFHWAQLDPRPTKPVVVHRLRVVAHRILKLVRIDLAALGVPESAYGRVNLPQTQQIGAAAEFLGCDGLIAPSARWVCDNLILFPDRMDTDTTLEVSSSETVDWLQWAREQRLIASDP